MYSGLLKGMSNRSSTNKEHKLLQKQNNRNPHASDLSLLNEELNELKNALAMLKHSLIQFSRVVCDVSSLDECSAIRRLHIGLGEVLNVIKTIVHKYPALSTPEVFASVHMLVSYVQSLKNPKICIVEADRLTNQLALYLTKSISQFILQLKESTSEKSAKNTSSGQFIKNTKSSAIFGMELEKHINTNKKELPFIVTKCIGEVEAHGLFVKGIYRVSAVKSKVNQLCEAFEKYGDEVNLKDVNPNIIANVLKLYLRELPQPLFTFELYPEFIKIAKLYAADTGDDNKKRCAEELRTILEKLPKPYYAVVAAVMQHLHRISAQATVNNMSAYNLAVIFGPTLLHCLRNSSETGSKAALSDNIHQIRAIELMITCSDILFPDDSESYA